MGQIFPLKIADVFCLEMFILKWVKPRLGFGQGNELDAEVIVKVRSLIGNRFWFRF